MQLDNQKEKKPPKKRIYTISELGTEFGATEWFWRTQIWQKNIPVIWLGRKQYIDAEDLEIFLEKHKHLN